MAKQIEPGVINNWDLMEEQVLFYRDHLDIFLEEQFPPLRLTPTQKIIVREFGRCNDEKVVCSRGYGKTFVIGLAAFGLCCLWPGTRVVVCSATAYQATLLLRTLKERVDRNEAMQAELAAGTARSLIQISGDKSRCEFKNGSVIESFSLSSARGLRAKVVIIDEALELDQDTLDAITDPMKNFMRANARDFGCYEYASKTVAITSACPKINDFYGDFMRVLRNVAKGSLNHFAVALDYKTAIQEGITAEEYFQEQKEKIPEEIFNMEYGSMFLGATAGSVFPFAMTDASRTLKNVELKQPKGSKSRYVISLDIATSEAKDADNSIAMVHKFTERPDGSFVKKVVYIKRYHGKGLDYLSGEMRTLYHTRFPNAEKIIYDARGVGDAFSKFFIDPWIDPDSGREYPPLVHDDESVMIRGALPVLHAVRAVKESNQRMVSNLLVAFEKHMIDLPMNSRILQSRKEEDEFIKRLSDDEWRIFVEADELQTELSHIIAKTGQSGTLYDTASSRQHKDRFSALAYGIDYISELEKKNMIKRQRGAPCLGFASGFEPFDRTMRFGLR